ncbi:MAG: tRNA 2-thiouridine(34) synthase MnmA, partial [Yaniella sp.]|nr:tRNA 2-thiouridine(34) synthase MnmA [Yaniella sp.]
RPKDNAVVVGSREMLAVDRITGIRPSWAGAPIAEAATGEWFDCHVQVRAHAEPVPGRTRVTTGDVDGSEAVVWQIELDDSIQGVAPGQTAVVYQGTRVLGQVTIHKSINAERLAHV